MINAKGLTLTIQLRDESKKMAKLASSGATSKPELGQQIVLLNRLVNELKEAYGILIS